MICVPTFGSDVVVADDDVSGGGVHEFHIVPELHLRLRTFDAYLTFLTSGDANPKRGAGFTVSTMQHQA